jgi:hypothetical protein
MFRTHRIALTAVLAAALLAVSVLSMPSAGAGGGPPRPIHFTLEAAYIGCVDDEVDEPGIDGDALVRVRLTNESPEEVVVDDGSWRVVAEGDTLAHGDFTTPADLPVDATWEQVVRIPGDTGAAWFTATVDVTGAGGTSTFGLEPSLGVPGDCPQPFDGPDDVTAETTTPTEPAPGDGVKPRFTG